MGRNPARERVFLLQAKEGKLWNSNEKEGRRVEKNSFLCSVEFVVVDPPGNEPALRRHLLFIHRKLQREPQREEITQSERQKSTERRSSSNRKENRQ